MNAGWKGSAVYSKTEWNGTAEASVNEVLVHIYGKKSFVAIFVFLATFVLLYFN